MYYYLMGDEDLWIFFLAVFDFFFFLKQWTGIYQKENEIFIFR